MFYIYGFNNIPVYLAIAVEVLESLEYFLEYGRDGRLVKHAILAVGDFHLVLDDVKKAAPFQQLENQPELIVDHKAGVVRHYILVVAA